MLLKVLLIMDENHHLLQPVPASISIKGMIDFFTKGRHCTRYMTRWRSIHYIPGIVAVHRMKWVYTVYQVSDYWLWDEGSIHCIYQVSDYWLWDEESIYTLYQVSDYWLWDEGSTLYHVSQYWLWNEESIYTVPGIWTTGCEMKGVHFIMYLSTGCEMKRVYIHCAMQVSDYWLWNEESIYIYTLPGIWTLAVRWREYTLSCIWVLAVKWREYIHCTRYLTTGHEMKRVYIYIYILKKPHFKEKCDCIRSPWKAG